MVDPNALSHAPARLIVKVDRPRPVALRCVHIRHQTATVETLVPPDNQNTLVPGRI